MAIIKKVDKNSTEKRLVVAVGRGKRGKARQGKRSKRYKICTFMYKINQIRGYIVQHRENSQNAISLNGIQSTTITESLCCMPKTNIMLQINYRLIFKINKI